MEVAGESTEGKVDLLLGEPPYNSQNDGGSPDSSYDVFTIKVTGYMLDLAEASLHSGAYDLDFYFYLIVLNWVQTLQKWMETVPASDKEEENAKYERNCFAFEKNDPLYFRNSGNCVQHASKRSVYHVNLAERAIHF